VLTDKTVATQREDKMKAHKAKLTLKSINPQKNKNLIILSISLLLMISLISLPLMAPVNASTATYTFGNSTVGSLTNWFGTDRDASRFQLTQNGILQSITAYFSTTGFSAKAAIYTDNNGAPSTLIVQSSAQSVTVKGWNTFAVPQTSLNTGYYWLCVVSSGGSSAGLMISTSSNSHSWKTNTYTSDYPSTFGTPSGYEKSATSIYATYTVTTQSTPPPTSNTLLLGLGHPSWAYDKNSNPIDIRGLVTLAASSHANCWREAMSANSAITSYQTNLKSYLDAAGIKLVIQTLASSVGAMSTQDESNIINNVGSAQSNWINSWGSKISQLQPYAIMVMNEPTNGGTFSTASSSAFAAYRQFCSNAISAWRLIKPDLVVIVNNDPFNDVFDSTSYGFAANPLPFTNIMYGRHIYYAYDNSYPPSYLPDQQSYWNGNTASGKQYLTNIITRESSALIAKGQTVIWDEWGANVNAPNAQAYVRDFISICRSLGISCLYYDFVPSTYSPTGLLNSDYKTLNAVGSAWASSCS
jgi:hypothetical protein